MDRRAFLDQEPPPGYVPGVGRGAVGFTTSADSAYPRVQPGFLINEGNDEDDQNVEEAGKPGGEVGLLTKSARDKDDEEADRIYDEIERRLQSKHRRNEAIPSEESTLVQENFADLKRGLSTITDDQWENLPEVGDLTRRNKRTRILEQQQQRFYAVPDNVLAGGSIKSSPTDFQSISQAKGKVLSTQLDNLVSTNRETIDIIESEHEQSDQQFADIKKGRLILASLRKTEPNKPSSWIASARLEEQAKNSKLAKNLIIEGSKRCPRNEDIWLENIRIHLKTNDGIKLSKMIVTEALKFNPRSETLWIQAFELENVADIVSRRKVIMRALENLPSSVRLWKELINIETEDEDVKKLLAKAVELCPKEWEFWLLLINLSEYSESKSILNKARKALKGNMHVWITACKLEEGENNEVEVSRLVKMIEKSFKDVYELSLEKENWSASKGSGAPSRNEWIEEAFKSETEEYLKTSNAIITNVLNTDIALELENRFSVWIHDANRLTMSSHITTAKFIYQYLIKKFPNDLNNWIELFDSLKLSGDYDQLFAYYEKAIDLNPNEELLVLMYSKDQWKLKNDIEAARATLQKGLDRLPVSEQLWLASIKLEMKTLNYDKAEALSERSLESIPKSHARVWYKFIHFLRFYKPKEVDRLLELSERGIELFPNSYKLHLQRSQILIECEKVDEARQLLDSAIKRCPSSPELWMMLAHIDEIHSKVLIKARSTLDRALLTMTASPVIWDAKISLERRNNDLITARQLTNKALKKHPSSPLIWYQYLSLISKASQRKNAFLDALKATDNDSFVLLSIGKFFWYEGKFTKAKSWFERSLTRDKRNGDSWSWLYTFMKSYGSESELKTLLDDFETSFEDINRGQIWSKVIKDVKNFELNGTELLKATAQQILKESNAQ